MFITCSRNSSPAGSSIEKAELDEVGFVELFDRCLFFGHGRGEGVQPNRPAREFVYYGMQYVSVGRRESDMIYAEEFQSFIYGFLR